MGSGDTFDSITSAPTRIEDAGSFTVADPSLSVPLPRLGEGEVIANRYTVTGLLGRGGFGEVYEVADAQRPGQSFALKMHRFRGTTAALEALKGEFALLRSLTHPNLAQVHDFGYVGDDVAFFTQAVVRGTRLDHARIDLLSPDGFDLLTALCRALDYLHGRGLLHRDVKPSNILVDAESHQLTLLDFGISRALGQIERGQLVGTYAYLAPEAIRGGPVDARSDLYALGVTLYALVAGRVPFYGSGTDVLAAHLYDAVPRLAPDRASAPIADVVARLLAKEPGERYASASEVLEAVAEAHGLEAPAEEEASLTSYVMSGSFVGERQLIESLVSHGGSARGTRPVTLLSGEAGTGKSRMLREVQQRLQLMGRSWVLVETRRGDDARTILGEIARVVLTQNVAQRLTEEDRVELARAVPSLRRRGERIAMAVDPERSRAARIEALGRALAIRFLHRPGVLAIEDVHWASGELGPSLAELSQAMRRAAAPCLLLCTCRPGEVADAVAAHLGAERLEVPPLGPEESRALVTSMFGAAGVLEGTELGRTLDARPHPALYVQESLRLAVESRTLVRRRAGWAATGEIEARELSEVLEARVAHLSTGAQELATALAVLAEPSSVAAIAATTGAALAEAAPSLSELVRAGIVEDRRDAHGRPTYDMHDRFVDVVLRRATHAGRRRMHQRAGRYLEKQAARDPQVFARAAEHLVEAAEPQDARRLFGRAASSADAHGRPDRALRYMVRSREVAPGRGAVAVADALTRHDLAVKAGVGVVADEALEELERLRRRATPRDRIGIDLRRSRSAARRGDSTRALRMARRALRSARKLEAPELEQELLLALGEMSFAGGVIDRALEEFESATRVAEMREDRPGIARSCLGASLALLHLGKLARAEAQASRAAQKARGSALAELRSEALRQLGNVARERSDNRRALSHYRRAVKAARAAGATIGEAKALNNLGTVAQWLGHVPEALAAFQRSRELKERAGARASLHVTNNNIGALYAAVGRLAEAREVLEALIADDGAGPMLQAIARGNLGDLDALDERLDEAISSYRLTLAYCREQAFAAQLSHVLSGLVRVLTMRGGAGDLEQTTALLAELDALRDADIAESGRRYHTARAAVLDARGDTRAALAEARLAVRVSDRETRFSDIFGTLLDARWQCALYLGRLGREQAAKRALGTCRAMLEKLVQQVGDLDHQRHFLHGHPLHSAVDHGIVDIPRGWIWPPRDGRRPNP